MDKTEIEIIDAIRARWVSRIADRMVKLGDLGALSEDEKHYKIVLEYDGAHDLSDQFSAFLTSCMAETIPDHDFLVGSDVAQNGADLCKALDKAIEFYESLRR